MNLLKRALYLSAGLWAALGAILVVAPGLLVSAFELAVSERAWIRIGGIQFFVVALLMVLVAHHAEDRAWWAWAFVLGEAAIATIALLKAAFGVFRGSPVPWWILGGISAVLTVLTVVGLGKSAQERPPT